MAFLNALLPDLANGAACPSGGCRTSDHLGALPVVSALVSSGSAAEMADSGKAKVAWLLESEGS